MNNILRTLVFVILLFLSPCKFWNFIQAELGIAQSQVLNPHKTSVGSSTCSHIEWSSSCLVKIEASSLSHHLDGIITNNRVCNILSLAPTSYSNPETERTPIFSKTPLYIFYQMPNWGLSDICWAHPKRQ